MSVHQNICISGRAWLGILVSMPDTKIASKKEPAESLQLPLVGQFRTRHRKQVGPSPVIHPLSKSKRVKQGMSLAAINRLDEVSSNGGVGGEQCHALKTRLRNQHAIKRIAVMGRQFACSQGVLVGDTHWVKLPPCERISNKFGRRKRQFQRAASELDRDFPCTDR